MEEDEVVAEDLGHFTLEHSPVVEIDNEARNIKLTHPDSGEIILSLSTEAAWLLGYVLSTEAVEAEKRFR